MEQNQIEHLKKLIASLAEWQLCMSYNDSYFGEPAGLVKSTSRELTKLIESASLDNSTPKSWRDPAKELPEVGQPCLFRYKHGIISGHFAGVDEYKQIIGRTYIWRDQTYIIYGWMPLDEANNWLAQSSAPTTVEAERTTAPVSLTDDDLTQEFSLDAIIKGIRYADHGRHEGWQAELKEYIRIECNRALLAAAPAPIQKEPSIPATPDEVIAFIGSNFDASWTQGDKEGWRYKMSVHDLLSAFSDWRDSAPAPIHETIVQQKGEMVCTACGTTAALAGSQVQAAGDAVQCTLGVGSGNGNLFVVGDYDSIKAAQAWILRATAAEGRLAEIQRGVEGLVQHGHYYDADDVNNVLALLQPQGQADASGLPG